MARPAAFALLAFGLLAAGCSARPGASGPSAFASSPSPAVAAPVTSPPSVPVAAPASAATSAPPAPAKPSAAASPSARRVPVLGVRRRITKGYGTVRPSAIDNGGDPTGIVTGVSWRSWGGPRAVATGTGYYDPPNVPVARAVRERATVVAFDLGTCSGRYMYQAVEWYFPESGGSFDPASYLNVCSWTYHPASGP